MSKYCTLQIFQNNQWIDCALIESLDHENNGWNTSTRTSYLFEYAIQHMDYNDGRAISFRYPVNVKNNIEKTWPSFLMDLLPQGFGRKELLRQLEYSENAQEEVDWLLLNTGSGNPIGNLRIKEAYEWLLQNSSDRIVQGFSLNEVTNRDEKFIEALASYGQFVAGSSGVQGEWPKLLLTQGIDDLFYLDHTISDVDAKKHWLVKFSRGGNTQLDKILSQEALYMNIARFLGLRVHDDIHLYGRTLFIPRFDRIITNGKVERVAQESIASLSGKVGFGVKLSHNHICSLLSECCTHPELEVIEYLKRDLANVALGNKDNHTRNTAIQRFNNGHIQLSPLYDFAPMWLHPDGIARSTRWYKDDEGGAPLWQSVIDQISEVTSIKREILTNALIAELPKYQNLLSYMVSIGIDQQVLENSTHRINSICEQLEKLRNG